MSTRLRGIAGVSLMAALLALYLGVAGWQAVLFARTGTPIGIGFGIALAVLALLGLWALLRELAFGIRSQRLADRLAAEGGLPVDELTRRPSGRPDRAAADAEFPRYREAVERSPEDWREWFRLGLAYDACGDRRRARQAIRTAIRLDRGQRA